MTKLMTMTAMLCFSVCSFAQSLEQKKMIRFIDSMADVYDSMYAPALWKKEFASWSLQLQVLKAKEQILAKEISHSDYHKIVNQFILSMKDYHVSVQFFATESSSLPFMIRGAEGRYFFVYIDRDTLPESEFPFELGDELLSLNGESISQIIKKLVSTMGGNTPETDQALAEMTVSRRRASRGQQVEQGPVELLIKKDGKELTHQLIWNYTKEEVLQNNKNLVESKNRKLIDLQMISDTALEFQDLKTVDNKFSLGGKKSYLPDLGKRIWSSDEESHFEAYIFRNEAKELVGYVRIPKYGAGEKETKQFIEIIKRFQETTDKLVIDQLNNPGGSVFYLYSLVSLLTDKALSAPKHYISINQKDIADSISNLEKLNKVTNREELKKFFGDAETVSGYPLTMNFLGFMKAFYQFKINEWNAGKTLTSPYYLYGVDKINPHPETRYTKPILLLVNELDFSGGDFFPAIMQDNKRATIMGVRTAGAGGFVIGLDIPNQLGIGSFRYTGSLADRVDHTPIENLGVKPEIDYSLTVEDFQKSFGPFKNAVNKALKTL